MKNIAHLYLTISATILLTGFVDARNFPIDVREDSTTKEDCTCSCCQGKSTEGTASYIAQTSGTWTTEDNPFIPGEQNIYFEGELRIPKGIDITIEGMNFFFDQEGIVVIEAGNENTSAGSLTLNGTLLSADTDCNGMGRRLCHSHERKGVADCELHLWHGVRVEGRDHRDQVGDDASIQGKFDMRNGSTIRLARIGVLVGMEDCDTCGGGIIRITSATFKDNPTGLKFDPYQRQYQSVEAFNRSKVENTRFVWTAELRDVEGVTPENHVEVRKSSGLILRGNVYENQDHLNTDRENRGIGLYISQSRVHSTFLCQSGSVIPCPDLVRSEFRNLKIGVLDYGGSVRTLQVHHNIFHNNVLGVNTYGVINPEILNSDFAVPNQGNSAGVYMVGSTGYSVENNSFVGLSDTSIDWNFGIVVHASGPFLNEIYRNNFKDLGTGISSAQVNAAPPGYQWGLRWKCNLFEHNMAFADIRVSSGGVSDEQGTCLTGITGPAGNRFSHYSLVNQTHYDIKVEQNADPTLEIKYRHHNPIGGNPAKIFPLRFTNGGSVSGDPDRVHANHCGIPWNAADACPVKNYGGPPMAQDVPDVMSETPLSQEAYEQSVRSLAAEIEKANGKRGASTPPDNDRNYFPTTETENAMNSLRSEEIGLWLEITKAFQKDTSGAIRAETLLAMLNEYRPNSGQRFTTLLASQLGHPVPEWINVENRVSDTRTWDTAPTVKKEKGALPERNDEWFTTGQFNSFSKVRALADFYASHNASFFPHFPDRRMEHPDGSRRGDLQSKGYKHALDVLDETSIAMRPNPFSDRLTVSAVFAQPLETKAILRFHNALGREVMVLEIPATTGDHEVDTRSLPAGLILYTVEINGEVIHNGKMVKMK